MVHFVLHRSSQVTVHSLGLRVLHRSLRFTPADLTAACTTGSLVCAERGWRHVQQADRPMLGLFRAVVQGKKLLGEEQ